MGKYVIKDKDSESYLVFDDFFKKWQVVHTIKDYINNNFFTSVYYDDGLKVNIDKLNESYSGYHFIKSYLDENNEQIQEKTDDDNIKWNMEKDSKGINIKIEFDDFIIEFSNRYNDRLFEIFANDIVHAGTQLATIHSALNETALEYDDDLFESLIDTYWHISYDKLSIWSIDEEQFTKIKELENFLKNLDIDLVDAGL